MTNFPHPRKTSLKLSWLQQSPLVAVCKLLWHILFSEDPFASASQSNAITMHTLFLHTGMCFSDIWFEWSWLCTRTHTHLRVTHLTIVANTFIVFSKLMFFLFNFCSCLSYFCNFCLYISYFYESFTNRFEWSEAAASYLFTHIVCALFAWLLSLCGSKNPHLCWI